MSRNGRDIGRVTVELDRDLYERLGRHAERHGQPIISVIRVAVANHLDQSDRLPVGYDRRLSAARTTVRELGDLLERMGQRPSHLAIFEDRETSA